MSLWWATGVIDEKAMYDFDHKLFLALNFDGGHVMDVVMETVSGTAMWIPLYLFILAVVWRKYGWKSAIGFVACLAVAMGLADMFCGIFKHSGLLKNLWESFPVRQRPMFTPELRGLVHVPSYAHGPYGTVSSHAATVAAMAVISAMAIRNRIYTVVIVLITLLICYSRIYLACHFPMDLLLGLAVGVISGFGMYFLWKKLDKVVARLSR